MEHEESAGAGAVTLPVWLVWMIRGRALRPTRTFTPCSRGGSGAANTRRGPGCLRKQNWRTNSAAGPTPRPGRSGHSSATGWPGGFSEEGTYRPDRMLIRASDDAPSRLRPQGASAPPPFVSPACLRTRGSTGIISRTQVSRTSGHAAMSDLRVSGRRARRHRFFLIVRWWLRRMISVRSVRGFVVGLGAVLGGEPEDRVGAV
jgi:hypothetical protein